MLTANELRTGNLVLQDGVYARIYSISLAMFNDNINDISVNKDTGIDFVTKKVRIEPILLTPEILEKCGFEKIGSDTYGDRFFTFFNGGILSRNYDKAVMSVCVDYLHQLQNLYFALTQTELIINL